MKKIIAAVTLCLMLAGVLVSCSSNSPEGVAEKFMKCMKNKDANGMVELLEFSQTEKPLTAEEIKEGKEQIAEMIEKKVFKSLDEKGGIKSYDVVSVEEKGDDKATVKMKTFWENGDEDDTSIDVGKDKNGNWKVLFELNK